MVQGGERKKLRGENCPLLSAPMIQSNRKPFVKIFHKVFVVN